MILTVWNSDAESCCWLQSENNKLYAKCWKWTGLETWRGSEDFATKHPEFIEFQFSCKILFLIQTIVPCLW